jgi:hypothetical protein
VNILAVAVKGTIAVKAGQTPTYQEPVYFDWKVVGKIKGYQYPLIYVEAYQDGVLVYGQLDHPDVGFILGGGSSEWVTRGGGAAECIAHLMIYPGLHSDPILDLNTVTFHSEG